LCSDPIFLSPESDLLGVRFCAPRFHATFRTSGLPSGSRLINFLKTHAILIVTTQRPPPRAVAKKFLIQPPNAVYRKIG
jgi:hypothetical protein